LKRNNLFFLKYYSTVFIIIPTCKWKAHKLLPPNAAMGIKTNHSKPISGPPNTAPKTVE
jgi:hypothetical protein